MSFQMKTQFSFNAMCNLLSFFSQDFSNTRRMEIRWIRKCFTRAAYHLLVTWCNNLGIMILESKTCKLRFCIINAFYTFNRFVFGNNNYKFWRESRVVIIYVLLFSDNSWTCGNCSKIKIWSHEICMRFKNTKIKFIRACISTRNNLFLNSMVFISSPIQNNSLFSKADTFRYFDRKRSQFDFKF